MKKIKLELHNKIKSVTTFITKLVARLLQDGANFVTGQNCLSANGNRQFHKSERKTKT